MRNISDTVVEEIEIHFLIHNFFLGNRTVCEVMWKDTVQAERSHMTIWRMHIACWIHKATKTPTEYVTFTAFPIQQWLHQRVILTRPLLLIVILFLRIRPFFVL